MDKESILLIVFLVLLVILEGAAIGGVGGWLDRRSSSTREEVEEDIDQYGAQAGGIRSELLPEDERREVLELRRKDRSRRGRWAWLIPH